jgi:hypothetical protein
MFTVDPGGVWIVTDTLATDLEGEPYLLVSKCLAVPHLELAVTFTGVANVGQEWMQCVQSRTLATDIDMVDLHAPDALRAVCEELDCPDDETSTIYHLGFSPNANAYVGYVYRSTNDFQSEEMIPSFRIKPDPPDGVGTESPSAEEEIIALAEAIRANEDTKPRGERIYVGGELVITTLASNVIASRKIHRFADFDEQWLTMNANPNLNR